MHIHEYAHYLKQVLKKELPGERAHRVMAPLTDLRKRFEADMTSARKSAVLLLLYPAEKGVHTLLIRRTSDGSPHSGQISLPGGKWEPGDKNLCETALREAEEEVGSNTKKLTPLGKLSDLFIPVSNFVVMPYIAIADKKPAFRPNPHEVAGLIPVSLHDLLSPENRMQQTFNVRGATIEAPCFHVDDHRIWGATAMILSEFVEILRDMHVQKPRHKNS